jgi:predicted exporter
MLMPAALLFSPIKIQTDIFSLLPTEEQSPLKKEAFDRVAKEASQKIIILFAAADKNEAYKAATDFYEKNKNSAFMKDADFNIGSDFKADISGYSNYRYHLLSKNDEQLLRTKNGAALQEKAVRNIYSPMASGLITSPKDDPFLLFNNFFMNLPISQSSLFPYNGVLMAEYEGKHYAFMALTLGHGMAFSITELADIMQEINTAVDAEKIAHKDVDMILTGVPIHSYYSSQSSKNELNNIGNISLFFTVLLIYFSFKSMRELFLSLFSLGLGCALAFTITHLIFGEVHLITLIFGTSLIGVAIDYSFPFFCEYLDKDHQVTAEEAVRNIGPGLTMGFLTSIMGYSALAMTPFPGLQQMACFSMVGLLVAYVIVMIVYPFVYKPVALKKKSFLLEYAERFFTIFDKVANLKISLYVLVALIIFTAIGLYRTSFNDDIRLLYTPSSDLMAKEILTRKVMGQSKASQFFLVQADSPETVLEKEEALGKELDNLITKKSLVSYNAISQIVPSIVKQQENYSLINSQLMQPYLNKQAEELGISKQDTAKIKEFFASQSDNFISLDEAFKHPAFKMLKPLWLGEINGSYASVILLNNVADIASVRNLNNDANGIYFMDKVSDISDIMQKYRHIAIKMLAIAYTIIFIVLYLRYGITRAALVFFPPVLAGLLTLALIGFAGYSINLFNILGLFLILAFGIDYTVFFAEGSERKLTTSIAIFLSFLTNILSFGLLAFSNFPVIHSFGLVMALGMLFSYLLAPIVTLLPYRRSSK